MSFMHFIEHRVTGADLAELREWEAARAAPRGAQFAGTVDATHERTTPCPRTLAQAFGEANAGGVIVPLPDATTHADTADRIVLRASALAAIALVPILFWTRTP